MNPGIKARVLIAGAGAMLVFEAAGVWGALSVSRGALHRAEYRRVRILRSSGLLTPASGTSACPMRVRVGDAPGSVAAALGTVLL